MTPTLVLANILEKVFDLDVDKLKRLGFPLHGCKRPRLGARQERLCAGRLERGKNHTGSAQAFGGQQWTGAERRDQEVLSRSSSVGPLVARIRDSNRTLLITELCEMLNSTEAAIRDIAGMGLKAVLDSLPNSKPTAALAITIIMPCILLQLEKVPKSLN